MGLIDGADKNLDGALTPSSPMLEPPLNQSNPTPVNISGITYLHPTVCTQIHWKLSNSTNFPYPNACRIRQVPLYCPVLWVPELSATVPSRPGN